MTGAKSIGEVLTERSDLAKSSTPPSEPPNSEQRLRRQDVGSAGKCLFAALGIRYADCRLNNFKTYGSPADVTNQNAAIAKLKAYCRSMATNVDSGRGIVLFGPPGTGKDHLLAAVMRAAFGFGSIVKWTDGLQLHSMFREGIKTGSSERGLIREFTEPEVLAISDPVPPWGKLTDYQVQNLFQIIDRRYRDCRPTWVSANFSDGDDAAMKIGAQIVDRLKDGALVIHCNWPSYRQQEKPKRGA